MTTEAFSHRDIYNKGDYSTITTRLSKLLDRKPVPRTPETTKSGNSARGFIGSLAVLLVNEAFADRITQQKPSTPEHPLEQKAPHPPRGVIGSLAFLGTNRFAENVHRKQAERASQRQAALDAAEAAFGSDEPIDMSQAAPKGYAAKHQQVQNYMGRHRRPFLMQPGEGVEPMLGPGVNEPLPQRAPGASFQENPLPSETIREETHANVTDLPPDPEFLEFLQESAKRARRYLSEQNVQNPPSEEEKIPTELPKRIPGTTFIPAPRKPLHDTFPSENIAQPLPSLETMQNLEENAAQSGGSRRGRHRAPRKRTPFWRSHNKNDNLTNAPK